jgi:hypothetical protein
MCPTFGVQFIVQKRAKEQIHLTFDRFCFKIDLHSQEVKEIIMGKPKTLNAAFIQIFGEALKPLGFKRIKSKYPYFVRLIGDEIIHIVTYRDEWEGKPGYKSFVIYGTVTTIYSESPDLTLKPSDNINWFDCNIGFYRKQNPFISAEESSSMFKKLYRFTYKIDDEESMFCEVKRSLEETERIMLAIFNEVTNLNKCIKYLYEFGSWTLRKDVEHYSDNNPSPYSPLP